MDASITIFTLILSILPSAQSVVPCTSTGPCERMLLKGSKCQNGFCTNPFQGGCLRPLLESDEYAQKFNKVLNPSDGVVDMQAWRRRLLSIPRTCNSEDGPDAIGRGLCTKSTNDYQEVRIMTQNWESAILQSWMMQIIYNELLGVPSTLETGAKDNNLNFYDETNRMDYGVAYNYEGFHNAYKAKGGDCTVYTDAGKRATEDDSYTPCAHILMEAWDLTYGLPEAQKDGVAEFEKPTGMIGNQGWHVTQSTLMKHPSLSTVFGMKGEENRQKLAEVFKRPTTWKYYCDSISPNNCMIPNDVATRPPAKDTLEGGLYFSLGSYTGFFRATEKNNCTKTKACTGHFMDYPCGWTSYFKQQTKHLNIALDSDEISGGYSYSQTLEIWNAANATKSDLIGTWWSPDITHKTFQGSGSDLTPVALPRVTQECLDNRVDVVQRCNSSATDLELYGDEKGSCGSPSIIVQKVAVGNLQSMSEKSEDPKARMSPAYHAYRGFSMGDVQIDQILTEWIERAKDKSNFGLRFATCKWMAENLEEIIEKVVPPSHPRIQEAVSNFDPLTIVTLVFSALSIIVTIGTTCGLVYKQKQGTLGRYVHAQLEFLALLLAGLLLVSIGSLLLSLEPSKGTCVGSIWMINVGYTMQLVPTMIRVSAIIKVVNAAKRFRSVTVEKNELLKRSLGVSALAALYCMFWTIFDPPCPMASFTVTDDKNQFGETIVSVSNSCNSNSKIWFMFMFISQGLLLGGASLLAWQMRSVPNAVNDSSELAVMIYSSFMFLVLRFVAYIFSESFTGGNHYLQRARSLLCSLDVIASIVIFFSRFFVERKKMNQERHATHTIPSARTFNISQPSPYRSSMPAQSVVSVEEEKKEEDSSTITFRMKDKSIDFPKWVVDEYGKLKKHDSKPTGIQESLKPAREIASF